MKPSRAFIDCRAERDQPCTLQASGCKGQGAGATARTEHHVAQPLLLKGLEQQDSSLQIGEGLRQGSGDG